MSNEMTLDQIAVKHQTDKATIYPSPSVHGYAPIYDSFFTKWRNDNIRLLEIGVCMDGEKGVGGHSVRMWLEYFKNAEIFTFDIIDMKEREPFKSDSRVKFHRGDQGNRKDLSEMVDTFGGKDFDIIIEDGSHNHDHQMISLAHLFKHVKSRGYFVIEDIVIPRNTPKDIWNEETYRVISRFLKSGKIESPFVLPDEKAYLEQNIKQVSIYPDIRSANMVIIIEKK
jgi:hypothetical protein